MIEDTKEISFDKAIQRFESVENIYNRFVERVKLFKRNSNTDLPINKDNLANFSADYASQIENLKNCASGIKNANIHKICAFHLYYLSIHNIFETKKDENEETNLIFAFYVVYIHYKRVYDANNKCSGFSKAVSRKEFLSNVKEFIQNVKEIEKSNNKIPPQTVITYLYGLFENALIVYATAKGYKEINDALINGTFPDIKGNKKIKVGTKDDVINKREQKMS